jgi:hypothetical protein
MASKDILPATTTSQDDNLLCEVAQLIQSVKQDWEQANAWTEWDQSVQDRFSDYRKRLAALAAADRSASPARVPDNANAAVLQAMLRTATRQGQCLVEPVSSRVCEIGTQSCIVRHNTQEPT